MFSVNEESTVVDAIYLGFQVITVKSEFADFDKSIISLLVNRIQ
jgi:hypothetical protein